MKELTINDLKKISLEILIAIDKFCDENNIKYTLGYGTLIGAIRHKGFIPWDDDIDILMPRKDYDRFIRSFCCSNNMYKLYAPELNLNYYAPYANVIDTRTYMIEFNNSHRGDKLGVKIDIYPIDGVPEDEVIYRKLCNKTKFYNRLLWVKRVNIFKCSCSGFMDSIKLVIYKLIGSVLKYSYIQKKLIIIGQKSPFENSKWVDNIVASPYYGKRHLKTNYDNFERKKFEGYSFMIASGFDEILTTIYGDYMKLPPIEERIPHHSFKAWWKD